jgi:hypothetical protein
VARPIVEPSRGATGRIRRRSRLPSANSGRRASRVLARRNMGSAPAGGTAGHPAQPGRRAPPSWLRPGGGSPERGPT